MSDIKQHGCDIQVSKNWIPVQTDMHCTILHESYAVPQPGIHQQLCGAVQGGIADDAYFVCEFRRDQPDPHSTADIQMTAESSGEIQRRNFMGAAMCGLQKAHNAGMGSCFGKLDEAEVALYKLNAIAQRNAIIFDIAGFVQQAQVERGGNGVQQT